MPVWLLALVLALMPVAGRKAIDWLPVTLHWLARATFGQLRFRRSMVRPRPAGTLALPGDAAALRQLFDPESGAVMVHDPHGHTLTAMVTVSHRSFLLLDPGEQQRRVEAWGRVLAAACRTGRIARLQVLERTLPDSGTGLASWWAEHGRDDGSWVASTYKELIERAGPAAEQHATTISLSLDLKVSARVIRAAGGGLKGAAAVLRRELVTLATGLRAADLNPGTPTTPGELAVLLRSAYDPAIAATLQRAGELGRNLASAGPLAVEEKWGWLRTDSGYHAVLWISECPGLWCTRGS